MDTTETSIKMCEKAREIQNLRPFGKAWIEGDLFLSKGKLCKFRFASRHKEDVWLPRQDQLQEMIEGTHIEKFGRVYRSVVKMELYPSDSMEQLWLSFVMKEKYNKVWNGEEWKDGK